MFLIYNSVKATSGINGALTNTQIKLKIPDSAEIFEDDTAKSANKGIEFTTNSTVLSFNQLPCTYSNPQDIPFYCFVILTNRC